MRRLPRILKESFFFFISILQMFFRIPLINVLIIISVFFLSLTCENVMEQIKDYNENFKVINVDPAPNAVNVPYTSVISVTLSNDADMSTVDSSTFLVNGGAVTGAYSYSPSYRQIIFISDSDLLHETLYTVEVTKGIKNSEGKSLESAYVWSFTTEQYYFNVSAVIYPLDNETDIPVNSSIVVEFDDNIDISTVTSATFIVDGGAGAVAGIASVDALNRTVTFTPAVDLLTSTTFTVTLTTGILNLTGQSMKSDYTWSFTTGAALIPDIYVVTPEGLDISSNYTYDMGVAVNGSTTNSAIFTIGNSGNSALTITGAPLLSDPTNYSLALASNTIAAGGITTLTVNFTPNSSTGTKPALITINSDDPNENPFYLNLVGQSVLISAPEIQIVDADQIYVSPDSTLNFGTIPVGDILAKTISIQNIGSMDLDITGISFGDKNPEYFSTPFVPCTIPAGGTVNVVLSFSAPIKINAKATITFTNNDADEGAFVVKLKGRTTP